MLQTVVVQAIHKLWAWGVMAVCMCTQDCINASVMKSGAVT